MGKAGELCEGVAQGERRVFKDSQRRESLSIAAGGPLPELSAGKHRIYMQFAMVPGAPIWLPPPRAGLTAGLAPYYRPLSLAVPQVRTSAVSRWSSQNLIFHSPERPTRANVRLAEPATTGDPAANTR